MIVQVFLIASTCLFWGLVTIFVVLEVRARRWLRRYPREWPEPVFDEQDSASGAQAEVLERTRMAAVSLHEGFGQKKR